MTDCYCGVVLDGLGLVHHVEKCSSCELRDALARPLPPPGDDEALGRRLAFESRLREAAAREITTGARVA